MSRLPFRNCGLLWLLTAFLAATTALIAQAPPTAITHEKLIHYVRERFSIPDTVKITMTDLRDSAYPDFLETTFTLDDGKNKQSQPLFISRNMRYLVEGAIFNLGGDPRLDIIRLITLRDQPAQGPASAPVTLVEFSDLECPVCAKLHQALESDIVPKYGNKLRVVFKEFPLVSIHDWALTAAIASQCVDQLDPNHFVDFRTAVYKNQESINADHARDLLLHFAAEAGIDNPKLAGCIDSKDSLFRVEANMREGEALGVGQTPTSFINGRSMVGSPPPADVYKLIDEAMHDNK